MRALGSALVGALRRILCRYWVITFEQPVPPVASLNVAPPPGVVIRRVTTDDATAVAPLLSDHKLEPRLAEGEIGLLAEVAGQVVGCIWLAGYPARVSHSWVEVRPLPHEAYAYGLHVVPRFRRRGLGRALGRALLVEARQTGASMVFARVSVWNRPALALQPALGRTPCEESFGLVLFGRFVINLRRRKLGSASWTGPMPAKASGGQRARE